MQVLVVFNPETDEVQVRGPWESTKEAYGAKRQVLNGHTSYDKDKVRLAVVGVTPMVYYDPDVHK